ncbi:hypothetical protein J6590_017435 [Homalodisca vitripennis]|nr:hypothetical protein J6590_017435 [Homalodisca vitripennis]
MSSFAPVHLPLSALESDAVTDSTPGIIFILRDKKFGDEETQMKYLHRFDIRDPYTSYIASSSQQEITGEGSCATGRLMVDVTTRLILEKENIYSQVGFSRQNLIMPSSEEGQVERSVP